MLPSANDDYFTSLSYGQQLACLTPLIDYITTMELVQQLIIIKAVCEIKITFIGYPRSGLEGHNFTSYSIILI